MIIGEKYLQAKLMLWRLNDRTDIYAVPNSTTVFHHEADLLTVTRSLYCHEFEIKRNVSDYKADFKKQNGWKHKLMKDGDEFYSRFKYPRYANYFWFVTLDFEPPDLPDYAGWISFINTGKKVDMWIKKEAPRLHTQKLSQTQINTIGRIMAYRLRDMWFRVFVMGQ